MLATEYNEEEVMELFKADGRREGREEGRNEERERSNKSAIEKLRTKLGMSVDQALDFLEIPQAERAKYKS